MTAIKSLIKAIEYLDIVPKNRGVVAVNAKCCQEVTMSNNEITNQLEQEYYDKSMGCSVKAQENNLFDYKSWTKN